MNWNERIESILTKEDFIRFTEDLSLDNIRNNEQWENKDISSYIEAIASWVEDMKNYYDNMKLDMPKNIDWKFIATLFYIGKIYE